MIKTPTTKVDLSAETYASNTISNNNFIYSVGVDKEFKYALVAGP